MKKLNSFIAFFICTLLLPFQSLSYVQEKAERFDLEAFENRTHAKDFTRLSVLAEGRNWCAIEKVKVPLLDSSNQNQCTEQERQFESELFSLNN